MFESSDQTISEQVKNMSVLLEYCGDPVELSVCDSLAFLSIDLQVFTALSAFPLLCGCLVKR